MGGNYLLNVGPMADGTFPPPAVSALHAVGAWFRKVREAFEDAQPASALTDNRAVLLTRRGNTLYVHLFRGPEATAVVLKPLALLPRRATLLNTGAELEARVDRGGRHHREPPYLRVRNLPANEMTDTVMVIRLEFDDLPLGAPVAP